MRVPVRDLKRRKGRTKGKRQFASKEALAAELLPELRPFAETARPSGSLLFKQALGEEREMLKQAYGGEN